MKEYGFIWKLKHWCENGYYPSKGHIRFLKWLATHPLDKKEGNEKIKVL